MDFDIEEIKESDSVAMKISKLLFAEFPEMKSGDPVATTKAACTAADVLGCVVALLEPQMSKNDFKKLMDGIRNRIDVSTKDIVEHGMALRDSRHARKH